MNHNKKISWISLLLVVVGLFCVESLLADVDVVKTTKDADKDERVQGIRLIKKVEPADTIQKSEEVDDIVDHVSEDPQRKVEASESDAVNADGSRPWGSTVCLAGNVLCVRLYRSASGTDGGFEVEAEVWGEGESVDIDQSGVRIDLLVEIDDDKYETGQNCENPSMFYPRYRKGFGHIVHWCFGKVESIPTQVELELTFDGHKERHALNVDEDLKALKLWNFLSQAKPVEIGKEFIVGPARITINSIAVEETYVVVNATLRAPEKTLLMVDTPRWVIPGKRIDLFTVNEVGHRFGWDEGKFKAFDIIKGGKLKKGTEQTGDFVLHRPEQSWALMITYGNNYVADIDGVILTVEPEQIILNDRQRDASLAAKQAQQPADTNGENTNPVMSVNESSKEEENSNGTSKSRTLPKVKSAATSKVIKNISIPKPDIPKVNLPSPDLPAMRRMRVVIDSTAGIHSRDEPDGLVLLLPGDVLFDFDSHRLRPDAEPTLRSLVDILSEFYPIGPIKLEGHTDSVGDELYNQQLSEVRAKSVAMWIHENGAVSRDRLHVSGFGESNPVVANVGSDGRDNPAGRQQNRRVEIVLAGLTSSR